MQLRLWGCDGTERIIPMLEAGPVSVLSWSEQQGPGLLCTSGRGQAARWHRWVASLGGINGWPFPLHPLASGSAGLIRVIWHMDKIFLLPGYQSYNIQP